VVVDGYQFGAAYQQAIKDSGLPLLVLDDFGHADHYYADLVLNQNSRAHESHYRSREPYTHLLLGPQYVLLRDEFRPWGDWQRRIPDVARRVLVSLGGADPKNVTLKVVQALRQVQVESLEAVIVVGASNPHTDTLQFAARRLRSDTRSSRVRTRIESNVTSMATLMAWADLAVSAEGSTCWELLYLGLPSIVLVLADNQKGIARELAAKGAILNMGSHETATEHDIATVLGRLAMDPKRRRAMSERGRRLLDGHGADRVARILMESLV
jgi:UDP-2,4-diacetamido-2,4,6-trideoxy-beta-L-altropyranose hydrolase